MARIRSLKPEFFKDEDLATLPFEARMLFEGLWCYADREGRLEDRPKYLKAEIFPYDNVDIEKLLKTLANPNIPDREDKIFIRRYIIDGKKYIDIPEFLKHQSPHNTEKESLLPCFNGEITVIKQLKKNGVQDAHYPKPVNHKSYQESYPEVKAKKKKPKTSIPADFKISDRVKKWAKEKNHQNLEGHFESFILKCKAKDYQYVDWDDAFMNAIRDNWAKIDNTAQSREPPSSVISCPKCGARCLKSDLIENGCIYCMNQKEAVQ
jgi:hypothetical protein